MKRMYAKAGMALMLCAAILSGCGESRDEKTNDLPGDSPVEFYLSSGVGAWGTSLTLNADGSFAGDYSDADAGDSGEDYPNGTIYVCSFEGRFGEIQQVDEYSYSMTLAEITTAQENGEVWIEDGCRYVATEPAGIAGGETFLFYLPETPVESVAEDFLFWRDMWFITEEQLPDTLTMYGLYNMEQGMGFLSVLN